MQPLPSAPDLPAELAARLVTALTDRTPVPSHVRHVEPDGTPRYTNRLVLESSPYLLQHAHNPVNWYAWSEQPFADARRLRRPVFLSIGYSTCHWCHVMAEESFEDVAIASFLNAHYIPVKMDREERPDVDAVYLRAAQRLAGQGGWPLSVWLTPDREPFFAGTYFPPHAGVRGAGPGFFELLTELARLFQEESGQVERTAQAVAELIRRDAEVAGPGAVPGSARTAMIPSALAATVEHCRQAFDREHGGLRLSQKFPSNVPIRLLLRQHQRTGDALPLTMAVRTLEAMAAGGIYDHLAGGFHRYATDAHWRVPHFEKMLYDNALLIPAYAEAWQLTKRADFARVVRETCDELLATFAAPEGGFFSATDADSQGVEGKYYVWSKPEIEAVLGPGEETALFLEHYGVTHAGPGEGGNVLYQAHADEAVTERLAAARARLAAVRRQRVPPARDEKILAAWNGLAMSAFATAGWVFAEPRYLEAATRTAAFLLDRLRHPDSGLLMRSFCHGRLGGPGFLDDYACVAAGLLDLFESTGEPRWFAEALDLCATGERRFADQEWGGWFVTGGEHEPPLVRDKSRFDGAEPSGGAVALLNAARLAAFTEDQRWLGVAARAAEFMLALVEEQPLGMGHALVALDFFAGPSWQIAVVAPDPETAAVTALVRPLRESFCPRKALVTGVGGSPAWHDLGGRMPWLKEKSPVDRAPTAYVCTQGRCDLPTSDPLEFARQLAGLR